MTAVWHRRTFLTALLASLIAASTAASLPVVAIDPGHGGDDSGAVGILPPGAETGLPPRFNAQLRPVIYEKDANLDVAMRLNAWLLARQFPTLMTRSTDNAGGDVPYVNQEADLKARTDAANAAAVTLFVSIHQNSAHTTASGTETYLKAGAPEVTHLLAAGVQRNLVLCLGLPDRGVKERSFYVLRNTTMPSILVEGGFLSAEPDVALLAQPDVRQKMAEAIGGAIFQYAGLGDPGPICAGVGAAPVPVPHTVVLTRGGRALTQRAGIDPTRGDLWIATVRDAAGATMSGVTLRARLPNGKGVTTTSRPDGKALLAVPRRAGRLVVAVAMPGVKVAARATVPRRVRR